MTSSAENPNKKIETHRLGQCDISFLPIVKGLKSNGGLVREVIDYVQPQAICLPVAQDGIDDMRTWK